jgi:hypothetical protein
VRDLRARLGLPLWGRAEYAARLRGAAPPDLPDAEVAAILTEREYVPPAEREEAVALLYALMVVDGALAAEDVPPPLAYERWNLRDLAALAARRGLSAKGSKADLQARLAESDRWAARAALAARADAAASAELAAAQIDAPPRPPNAALGARLAAAAALAGALPGMELPALRVALLRRRLSVLGTREVLAERLREDLRADAVEALAGPRRLAAYAAAAVGRLADADVGDELAARGLSLAAARADARGQLARALAEEWVDEALAGAGGEGVFGPGSGSGSSEGSGDEGALASGDEGAAAAAPPDPTLDVVLLCDGATAAARAAALAAARAALPGLQSDPVWGTILSYASAPPLPGAPGGAAPPPPAAPPAAAVDVAAAMIAPNGLLVSLDAYAPPPGCVFVVAAAPVDGGVDGAASATVEVESSDPMSVLLPGLRPGAAYEVSARLRNAAGDGPPGEPLAAATYARAGIAVRVLYPVGAAAESSSEPRRYVELSWEELHASTAAELDARLDPRRGGAAAACGAAAADFAAAADVVLPLGYAPGAGGDADGAGVVGAGAAPAAARLAASRAAFADAARGAGHPAPRLLELDLAAAATASPDAVAAWLSSQGADPELTKVAVRLEAGGGEVLTSGLGRGAAQLAAGAAALAAEAAAEPGAAPRLVLEAVPPGGVFVRVSVLGTAAGPVALTPTEVGYYCPEEELDFSELQYQRFLAVRDGADPAAADALAALWREERRAPPGALGRPGGRAQAPRHATPPAALPPAAAEAARRAAAQLFAKLGLRDYAEFAGWVAPEAPAAAAGLEPALELLTRARAAAAAPVADAAAPRVRAAPFSELAALGADAEPAVSAADRAGALDVGAAPARPPPDRYSESPVTVEVQYGLFEGVELDGRTREDLRAARPAGAERPIPDLDAEAAARAEAEAAATAAGVPDLSGLDAGEVARGGGFVVSFGELRLTPDLGAAAGPLAQAAAAAGLSLRAVARLLVGGAAARAGLGAPPQPWDARATGGADGAAEPWAGGAGDAGAAAASAAGAAAAAGATLDDVGAALAAWAAPPALPAPESYEEIRSGGEGEGEGEGAASNAEAYDGAYAEAGAPGLGDEPWSYASSGDDAAAAGLPGLEDEEEDPGAALARRFPGLHPSRQRVWVLAAGAEGGGGDDAAGVRGALAALAALAGERDLLVEGFLLDPPGASEWDADRRRTLLSRRLDLRRAGASDAELLASFPELHPTRVLHPAPPGGDDLEWRGVWRLAGGAAVRGEAGDQAVAAAAALAAATAPPRDRAAAGAAGGPPPAVAGPRRELAAAGVAAGGAAPWGGALAGAGADAPPPRYLSLGEWADAAAARCAAVLICAPGHPAAAGPLQAALEARGVPFAGAAPGAAELCADRGELLRQVGAAFDYDGSRVRIPLAHALSAPELLALADSAAGAEALFGRLFGAWEPKRLVARPARGAGAGAGVARLGCGADLRAYAAAVRAWAPAIPAGALSLEAGEVAMPLPPPPRFVLETAADVAPLELHYDAAGAPIAPPGGGLAAPAGEPAPPGGGDELHRWLHWPTPNGFLEVKAVLLGGVGGAACLGLATPVVEVRARADGGADRRPAFDLSPPPPGALHPAAAADAAARLQQVADRLGLGGAVAVAALVNARDGEMVVLEADPRPDLAPGSLLLRLAAAARGSPAREPVEVARELLRAGMERREGGGSGGAVAGAGPALPGDPYSDEDEYGGGGAGGGPAPLGSDGMEGGELGGGALPGELPEGAAPAGSDYWSDPCLPVDGLEGFGGEGGGEAGAEPGAGAGEP